MRRWLCWGVPQRSGALILSNGFWLLLSCYLVGEGEVRLLNERCDQLLPQHGAAPGDTDGCGATALHFAARGGHLAIVERLMQLMGRQGPSRQVQGRQEALEQDGGPAGEAEKDSDRAADGGEADAAAGTAAAAVHAVPDGEGRLPLHWAAAAGQAEVVEQLLGLPGADPLAQVRHNTEPNPASHNGGHFGANDPLQPHL